MTILLRLTRPLSLALLLASLLSGAAFSQTLAFVQQQPAPSAARIVQLKSVLLALQEHYGIEIVFEDRLVSSRTVSTQSVDYSLSVEANLETILRPTALRYKKIRKGTYVIIESKPGREVPVEEVKGRADSRTQAEKGSTFPTHPIVGGETSRIVERAEASKRMVSGTVRDESGAGLPGVSVVLKGTQRGTTTNAEGEFQLDVPDESSVLVFSFVGYTSQEIVAGSQSNVSITLTPDNKQLEEVVVVGYGTQRKKDLTGAVMRVDPKLNATNPNVNASQALRGSVAGVTVTDTGRPGADGTIRIRGASSISANNSPLIVLDGIIYTGGLSDINANDIESIDILKDASSAAIYGSRATNGVILITTKKGNSPKPRLSYNAYYGMSDYARTPRLMGPERYLQMKEDAAAFLGRPVILTPTEETNFNAGRTIDPWEAIAQRAPMTSHELSLSGVTEKINYYVSGSYTDMKGRIFGDNFSRFSSRINLDIAITDWLNIGTNTGFTLKNYSGVPANINNASYLSPYSTLFYEDGVPKYLPMDDGLAPNPLFSSIRNDNLDLSNTLFNNLYADIALPVPGLSYRMNMGNNLRYNETGSYSPAYNRDGINIQGQGSKGHSKHHYFTMENILKYNKAIGQIHNLDVTALYSFETTRNSSSSLSSNNIFSDALSYNALNIGENQTINTTANEARANSIMGRVGYRLLDRYMLNFTLRRDGYSAFGAGKKYGNFPSVGVGWLVSDEGFMQGTSAWLSYLKLRYSYGKNGNRGIDPYASLSNMNHTSNQYVFGDNGTTSVGISPTSMANLQLGWETTVASNFGVDFSILKERISGAVEVYSMKTTDLLLSLRIPNMTGYETFFANIGGTSNRGFELTLNTQNVTSRDFTWSSNFVFSLNRNKITRLSGIDLDGDGREDDDIASRRFIGYPQGTNFDYVVDGVWQVGEENTIDPSAKPGYLKFRDVSGDGKIGPEDRQVLHSSQPRFTSGLTNRLAYKGFSLSFLFNAHIGGYSPNSFLNHGTNFYDRTNLMDLPYWTPENPLNNRPSIGYPNPLGYGFYQSRSFIRFQDVSLGYDFPKNLLAPVRIDRAKVYVSGKNLVTWTQWDGWDPEHGSGGRGPANGPLLKSWVVGINLGL
ncbi:TonB-dependent receptor [Telluribacter sp. SYSU D00476]|uniref:SusC/RagA family TonB-linked outer membrane protein n=1 Tax=Telluribacter sp. SYSU D00476 TaxID=2811430 RepID=UPI001FF2C43A|nr:TonB-dependent receptor [Telluribacter sp. SYSU D00476]